MQNITGGIVFENEDAMLSMWGDSLKDIKCKNALITYEDFVLLMKGQTRDGRNSRISLMQLAAVPEIALDDEEASNEDNVPDLNLTPPQTPVRGPADYVTPTIGRGSLSPNLLSLVSPPIIPVLSTAKGRSFSLDEKALSSTQASVLNLKRDSLLAMAIPEHTHNISDIDRLIEDKTKTPLYVNRKLYRAHREFRHSVTEACKRFELEEMRRAEVALKAQEFGAKRTAGLVMRHGQGLSEQAIRDFLKRTMDEQQKQVDQANKRGGRGCGNRKKTISDMSGMLAGPSSIESTVHPDASREEVLAPVNEDENLLRNPTKPGEFRKTTYDPFQCKRILTAESNTENLHWTKCRSVSMDEIDKFTC